MPKAVEAGRGEDEDCKVSTLLSFTGTRVIIFVPGTVISLTFGAVPPCSPLYSLLIKYPI